MHAQPRQSCATPSTLWTVVRQAPLSGILQARILEWIAMPSSRGSSDPGTEPASPTCNALKTNSLPTEPQEKFINGITLHLMLTKLPCYFLAHFHTLCTLCHILVFSF